MTPAPILLWGVRGDAPLDAVADELGRRSVETVLLDQRANEPIATELEVDARGGVTGCVSIGSHTVDLSEIGAAFIRPFGSDDGTTAMGVDPEARRHALEVDAALCAWADLTPAPVVNRPGAMAANNSKPYQLASIATHGLAVPDTLVTTDPDAVRSFWERHGRVVYKSVSGTRSIVSQLRDEHLDRLADVANAPTQFQQHIPGVDVRVHVAGDDYVATAIMSDADDYRYASLEDTEVMMAPCQLPPRIATSCTNMVKAMDLLVAGVDLRRTPSDDWYCLEVNPCPAFSYYEEATGQPICSAVTSLLVLLASA